MLIEREVSFRSVEGRNGNRLWGVKKKERSRRSSRFLTEAQVTVEKPSVCERKIRVYTLRLLVLEMSVRHQVKMLRNNFETWLSHLPSLCPVFSVPVSL